MNVAPFRQMVVDFQKHAWLAVALIVATALGVRVLALISLQASIYADFLLMDEQVYHQWAIKMVSGEFGPLSVFDFTPLPAYVMAAVYSLVGPDPIYVRILNLILGAATCGIIFQIGNRLGGFYTGLASGLIAALYQPFVFFSVALHKTAMAVFLFSAFVLACLVLLERLAAHDRSSVRGVLAAALLAGVSMALLINVRSNALVMLPVALTCAAWACRRERVPPRTWLAAIGGVVLGFALAAAPFVARDHKLTGEWSLTPAGGFNLYIANNPDNPFPYYRPVRFATSAVTQQAIGFVIEASRRQGRKLTLREASSYWTGEVIGHAMAEPGDFARRTATKALAALNRYESADNHHLGFLRDHIAFLRWPLLTIGAVMSLGMAGLVLMGFTNRQRSLAALMCLAYGATMVLFFTNVRIRLPALVLLIPFAVLGLRYLASAIKEKAHPRTVAYAAATLLFFICAFAPVPGDKDFTAYLNVHASNLASKGRLDGAVAFWEASAAMEQPYSAFANLALAERLAGQGDFAGALARIERVPDDSLFAARKYEALGDLFLRWDRLEEAIDAYKRSLDIQYGQRQLRLKLFRLYLDIDPTLADREYAVFEYISSFYGAMQ